MMGKDFAVENCGSVWRFTPVSESAKEKTKEFGLQSWQFLGESFVIDWRPAQQLVDILRDEGFDL